MTISSERVTCWKLPKSLDLGWYTRASKWAKYYKLLVVPPPLTPWSPPHPNTGGGRKVKAIILLDCLGSPLHSAGSLWCVPPVTVPMTQLTKYFRDQTINNYLPKDLISTTDTESHVLTCSSLTKYLNLFLKISLMHFSIIFPGNIFALFVRNIKC